MDNRIPNEALVENSGHSDDPEPMDTNRLGELGLILVKEQLIRIGLFAVEMPKEFDFDLFTSNNLRIEVKSARKRVDVVKKQGKYEYEQTSWTFNNSFQNAAFRKQGIKVPREKRLCDFYVLVCFNRECTAERFYIVPTGIINHQSMYICINENKTNRQSRSKFASFLNSWDLLIPLEGEHVENGTEEI